jgi:hypothetical protein
VLQIFLLKPKILYHGEDIETCISLPTHLLTSE